MCRSISQGGRRCPHLSTAVARRLASATQRMSRYARWADAAIASGDHAKADRYDRLLEKACNEIVSIRSPHGHAERVAPVQSREREFTADSTRWWTDDQWDEAIADCFARGDQRGSDQLMRLMDAKEEQQKLSMAEKDSHALAAAEYGRQNHDVWSQSSSLLNPARRSGRRLTVDQQTRADFDAYVDCQWAQAEQDCKGQLLTPEARARGISSRSLFQGPTARAERHASEELKSWWQYHGRLNFAAFRYHALGRDSDRAAAERNRKDDFLDAPAWSEGAA